MRAAAAFVLVLVLARPALAQEDAPQSTAPQAAAAPSDDPIGDVLSGVAATEGMDDDQAEATAPPVPAPAVPAPVSPAVVAPMTSPAPIYIPPAPPPAPISRLPTLDRPVMIGETNRTPEAPPTATEQAYESRIRGGLLSAQGLQGPLDGGWVLRGPSGEQLYSLQLVDKASGGQPLEGAWRSLRADRPAGGVGLVDTIERTATGVYLRFLPRGAREPLVLNLTPSTGGWSGDLWEGGSTRPVTMRRN